MFLQNALFGLFASPASSHHLATADARPVHFYKCFFFFNINKWALQSAVVRVCVYVCDALSAIPVLRVSPEHKTVCSNPISPERETSSPKRLLTRDPAGLSAPFKMTFDPLHGTWMCVLPRASAAQAFTLRRGGVIKAIDFCTQRGRAALPGGLVCMDMCGSRDQ